MSMYMLFKLANDKTCNNAFEKCPIIKLFAESDDRYFQVADLCALMQIWFYHRLLLVSNLTAFAVLAHMI
jgi:hypothetical protein